MSLFLQHVRLEIERAIVTTDTTIASGSVTAGVHESWREKEKGRGREREKAKECVTVIESETERGRG